MTMQSSHKLVHRRPVQILIELIPITALWELEWHPSSAMCCSSCRNRRMPF